MTRPYVQVVADGSGKKIDNQFVTDDDGTQTTYRQTVTLGDSLAAATMARVRNGLLAVDPDELTDFARLILVELQVMNTILATTLNSRDDIDALRASLGG